MTRNKNLLQSRCRLQPIHRRRSSKREDIEENERDGDGPSSTGKRYQRGKNRVDIVSGNDDASSSSSRRGGKQNAGKCMACAIDFEAHEINTRLKTMVEDEVDTETFRPMHESNRIMVQRLAAIYLLRCYSQGPRKHRYIVVKQTSRSRLPTCSDRIDKLMEKAVKNVDCNCNNLESDTPQTKSRKIIRKRNNSHRGMKSSGSSLFLGPVFISSGFLQSTEMIKSSSSNSVHVHPCPPKFKAYEGYMSGYGSKLLAKMGYSGGGLDCSCMIGRGRNSFGGNAYQKGPHLIAQYF
ncbi:uncharacterized protein LOC120255725 [Dioscorea cayenensis subsp. rotundata]|uniref:Uncharacterized protein LOC120255725 n=1 Tax=Dioscorea cayennensis subsp. rotundata TaxID=55577 RepID=A0AB40AWR9_DIOCR|nr:uncharacterized protein LOC120255725 [Dioscorea cayenensis subsp. rotundata]